MQIAAYTALFLSLALAPLVTATEVAVLDNGMRLQAQSVEREGNRVILLTPGGGRIEIAAVRLASIEHIEDPPAEVNPPPAIAQQPAG